MRPDLHALDLDAEYEPIRALQRIAEMAHKAANSGLDTATRKATAADLKRTLREIRDVARAAAR